MYVLEDLSTGSSLCGRVPVDSLLCLVKHRPRRVKHPVQAAGCADRRQMAG